MRAARIVSLFLVLATPLAAAEWSLIVSGVWIERTGKDPERRSPTEPGEYVDFDLAGGAGMGVGLLWQFSQRWAVETKASWVALNTTVWLVSSDAKIALDLGDLDVVPLTVVFQWRPELGGNWDPYAGIGGAYIFLGDLPIGPARFEFTESTALVLNAGVDHELSGRWFLNADVKYLPIETEVEGRSSPGPRGEAIFEPLIASAGVRFQF